MSLEQKTEYGLVKVNDYVFAEILIEAIKKTNDNFIFASQSGKALGGIDKKVSIGELVSNILIEDSSNKYILGFFVISKFGASIEKNVNTMTDYLREELQKLLPEKPIKIIIKLVGIKSKQIASRDIEIVREYEPIR